MRPLAKPALIGTAISLSLTLGVAQHDTASDRSLNLDHDSWIPGGLGASAMFHVTYADIFALAIAKLPILVTIGNAIFYCCVSHFLLRAPRDG